jgi:hypothetical protein
MSMPVDTARLAAARAAPAPATTAWATGNLHIQTILSEWDAWEGKFLPFCDHLAEHFRVPYKRTAIAAVLEAHGIRLRRPRVGRSPDETALRESFETFFPAQWVAERWSSSPLGERFAFNPKQRRRTLALAAPRSATKGQRR